MILHARCLTAVKKTIADHGLQMEVISKDESLLMKAANAIVKIFNPRFMKDYATVIPFLGKVYIPSEWYADDYWRVLAHEGVHLDQAKRDGQLSFALKYMFPQVFALAALGAVGAFWFLPMLWCLGFLLFLAPLPAPYRVRYEREAYQVTAAIDKMHSKFDITSDVYTNYMVEQYTGFGYYKPAWRTAPLREKIAVDMVNAEAYVDASDDPDRVNGKYSTDVIWTVKAEIDK